MGEVTDIEERTAGLISIGCENVLFDDPAIVLAKKILYEVMLYRRVPKNHDSCNGHECQQCLSQYLPKILLSVRQNKPVSFVLPAFPGKSPNPEKVLGVLPDQAEELSLIFLGELCRSIKNLYKPGIKIIICSDGRVFSDVVAMKEKDISNYQAELKKMVYKLQLTDISLFNLDDIYTGIDFTQMRINLMSKYGRDLKYLQQKIRNGRQHYASSEELEASRMYLGITKFLFEDSIYHGQIKTRSAIQKESRKKAYEVIRRSNAWSELIVDVFPSAVRLSIHPQTCGSDKLGIRLIGNESWMTPWHGVAVKTEHGHILLKRSEAEALGAKLVYSKQGLPNYYKLDDINKKSSLREQ